MKIGLVIPVYNRPEYLRQCLVSLNKLTTKPDMLVFVNDASTDPNISQLLSDFEVNCKASYGVNIFTNTINVGVRKALQCGIVFCFNNNCDIVINLDSDAIVKPDFIKKLNQLHMRGGISSGFNCRTNPKEILSEHSGYCLRTHANGINMCFNKAQYEKYIKPALLIEGNWDYNTSLNCQKNDLPFIISVPSVVQHIGMVSSMGHNHQAPDVAFDYKMLSLPDVTLFGIDAHDPAGLLRAADICQRDIEFGHTKLVTERLFTGREAYSKWILKELAAHIQTTHVLIIHPDGYVLNWQAWDNSWLQYDYIGATWWYKDNMNVGNGGFSLRSKKLMDIMATQPIQHFHPEDDVICRTYRESLERDFGIKFAPEEVANKFSIEAYGVPPPHNKYSGQFGFHGVHVDFNGSDIPEWMRFKRPSVPAQAMPNRSQPQYAKPVIHRPQPQIKR